MSEPPDSFRQLSPCDIIRSLIIALNVGHGAVTITKCFSSHHIIPAVTQFSSFVEVGKRCNHVCQGTKISLTWVVLQRSKQLL